MIVLLTTTLGINMVKVGATRISINSKTYQEGNTNLVLNKILSDNELKQELPHMFNYASNGNYINSSYEELNDSDYVTEGLYSNVDEDGTTYYYRGNINNNNLQFGAYDEDYYVYQGKKAQYYQSQESCEEAGNSDCSAVKLASAGDKMYWKIVRVNGDGSIRLIYNGTSSSPSNSELASSFSVGYVPYNLKDNEPKYTGYTYDNGTDSFIKRKIDTWYNNTLGKNSNYDSMVVLGRFCSDSSGYQDGRVFGSDYAFASMVRLGQFETNFVNSNAPTFMCPVTSESYGGSYRLKAGLITADELVFSGENFYVEVNSYLNSGESNYWYWSMTSFDLNHGGGDVWTIGSDLEANAVDYEDFVRPVINVVTNNYKLNGNGTMEKPYTLQAVEPEESGSVDNNQENSFTNPETRSMIAIGVTIGLIIVLGTGAFIIYRKKMKKN